MREKKYGFVYIWFDRKHKRYYIGCHWGTEDDGYVCSSRWMRKAYKRRPEDFGKRRTLVIVYNRKELLKEEYRWLSMIKDEELGKRYYNLSKKHFGHWSSEDNRLNIGQKITASPLRCENIAKALLGNINGKGNKGKLKPWLFQNTNTKGKKIHSEEHKRELSEQMKNNKYAQGYVHSEETKKKISEGNIGKGKPSGTKHKVKRSEEERKRISERMKGNKNGRKKINA